jgi:nitroreductase
VISVDAINIIKTRRSVRNFTDQPITKEILEDVIDCGRLAPSGHNKQGRYFLVLTERDKIDGIGKIATWAKFIVGKAQACILVFCDEKQCLTLLEDGAAATENILLAATAHGIASCWVAGYGMPYAAAAEKFAGAAATLKLVSIIALGYPVSDNPPIPPKSALSQVIKWNNF